MSKRDVFGNEYDNFYNNNYADDYYEPSYGRYAGSYAQDVEGWSDDDIDAVLDGDPDAYWNIYWFQKFCPSPLKKVSGILQREHND